MKQLLIVLALLFAQVANADEISKQQAISESVAKIKESLRKETNQPQKKDEPTDEAETPLMMFKGLCICLGVFLIGVGATKQLQAKRLQKLEKTSRLHIIEKVAVTSKTALVLAECDGQKIIFSVGAENVSFCSEGTSKSQLSFAELYPLEENKGEKAA